MPKFFITEYDLVQDSIAYITGEDARHLKKSLRVKTGENIIVCDGKGSDFIASVETLENDAVMVRITEKFRKNGESGLKVNLFTAITKGDGFEYAIQKCVEAGVYSVFPIITERTVVSIPDSKVDRRVERWNRIATEAAKQSGRSLIPNVAYPINLKAALKNLNPDEPSFICYVGEGTLSIKAALQAYTGPDVINIFIGPEGGFTEDEWQEALHTGVKSISLGKRILKAETAGLFTMAAIMYEYGELDKKE